MNRTHFLDYPDTFIWIFCVASGHFPNYPEILQRIMNMTQKLSRFAKTFRSALLTRLRGFSDSGPLQQYGRGAYNKERRKGGRSLYYHVESVACLLFTIAIIVATRAIIYLLALHLPQKMLPPFVFAAFLFSTVPVKGEGDILKVRDDISTLN